MHPSENKVNAAFGQKGAVEFVYESRGDSDNRC